MNYPLAGEAIRLSKDPRYSMQAIYDVGSHYAIWMNVAVPPLDNRVVRQALNYAIDRQRFIDTGLGGLVGPPMNLPWPTYSAAYEASKNSTYPFDLDKAKVLLASTGVTGFDTVITYATVGEVTEFSTMAQIYQADLATIGINATLQPLDNATWTDAAVKAAYQGLAVGHPGGLGAQDATSGLQTGAFGIANTFTNFSSPEYTQTVQAAAAEIDVTRRRQLYSNINDIILDNCFTIAWPARIIARVQQEIEQRLASFDESLQVLRRFLALDPSRWQPARQATGELGRAVVARHRIRCATEPRRGRWSYSPRLMPQRLCVLVLSPVTPSPSDITRSYGHRWRAGRIPAQS